MTVELDLVSRASISKAFATIRSEAGEPDVLVFNAGYLEGRESLRECRSRPGRCRPLPWHLW